MAAAADRRGGLTCSGSSSSLSCTCEHSVPASGWSVPEGTGGSRHTTARGCRTSRTSVATDDPSCRDLQEQETEYQCAVMATAEFTLRSSEFTHLNSSLPVIKKLSNVTDPLQLQLYRIGPGQAFTALFYFLHRKNG